MLGEVKTASKDLNLGYENIKYNAIRHRPRFTNDLDSDRRVDVYLGMGVRNVDR